MTWWGWIIAGAILLGAELAFVSAQFYLVLIGSAAILVGLAVGVGSLTGSRALALTAVIGWQAIVTEMLLSVTSLGSARDGLLNAALGQIVPAGSNAGVAMATGVAVAVLAGWAVVPAVAGAWRTRVRDA